MQAQIVEKEQRLRPLHDEVVDVHRHAVDADGIVDLQIRRELDLGAHAIRTGHENRISIIAFEELFVEVQPKHPRERPMLADHAWPMRPFEHGLNHAHHTITGIDINARFGVRQAFFRSTRYDGHTFSVAACEGESKLSCSRPSHGMPAIITNATVD